MHYEIEYSQIVRRKLKTLKSYLSNEFGEQTADQTIKKIIESVRGLEQFPLRGRAVSSAFQVDTDFRYLYVKHNYLFYYLEGETVIVAEMFHEKEDFMYKLFGVKLS